MFSSGELPSSEKQEARQSAVSEGGGGGRRRSEIAAVESARGLTWESVRAWLELEIIELEHCEFAWFQIYFCGRTHQSLRRH